MHQALRISEIIQSIVSYFAVLVDIWELPTPDPIVQRQNRQMLLNCALTCSAFKGPSLNMLWENMDSLGPLLRMLPEDALSDVEEWGLIRALDGHEWTGFKTHASRMRLLALDCEKARAREVVMTYDSEDDREEILLQLLNDYGGIHGGVFDVNSNNGGLFQDIQAHRTRFRSQFSIGFFSSLLQSYMSSNKGAILPNLQSFLLRVAEPSDFDSCAMIMMSGLAIAKTRAAYNTDKRILLSRMEAFFDAITHSQSRRTMRKLHIPGYAGMRATLEQLQPLFRSCLRMLSSLRRISSVALPRDLLQHMETLAVLAQQPYLEQLQLGVGTFDREDLRSEGVTFPHLRSIKMDLLDMQEIMPLCNQDAITTVCTWLREGSSETPWEIYCDAALLIAERCTRLITLEITLDWPEEEQDDPQKSIPTTLSPILFGCKMLVDIRIRIYDKHDTSRLNPSDHDYTSLARSWPLLKKFTMNVHPGDRKRRKQASRATLQGVLDAFATHCELDTLVLRVNFSWDQNAKPPGDLFSSLRMLDLEEMMITPLQGVRGRAKSLGKEDVEIWEYLKAFVPDAVIRAKESFGPPVPQVEVAEV